MVECPQTSLGLLPTFHCVSLRRYTKLVKLIDFDEKYVTVLNSTTDRSVIVGACLLYRCN